MLFSPDEVESIMKTGSANLNFHNGVAVSFTLFEMSQKLVISVRNDSQSFKIVENETEADRRFPALA